ncbi:MAG: SPOR domain-containing protein [Alphaproteobacteria bacterium]|nr:SPOR domain-containing protein [Alphaproteobacteria bacterium]
MLPDKNNDELLNDLRQKLANQTSLEYEEKRNELNVSKNVFIGAVSGIALAAVVGWFVLSPHYAGNHNNEIPIIRRPQEAIKVQPEDRGGMEILNQDKTVYNIIDKENSDNPAVERILPPPEEPQLPEIKPENETPNIFEVTAENTPSVPSTEKTIKAAEEIIKEETNQTPKIAETIKLEPVKETKEPKIVKTPSTENNIVSATGPWRVQLMASTNRNAVANSWKSLTSKYRVLQNQPHEIETADLGAKGTFYRLHAGAFNDRSGADNLCKDIKVLGGSCIVKKK